MSLNGYPDIPLPLLPYPTRGAALGPGEDECWGWTDDEEPRDNDADWDDHMAHREREGDAR